MQDIELYKKILGITSPWVVSDVRLELKQRAVTVLVNYDDSIPVACPVCAGQATIYDHQLRRWRHLDTMQLKTLIECEVPRARCEEHGVKQLPVAWAEANARFTALFEALVIGWLKEASISAVAEMLGLAGMRWPVFNSAQSNGGLHAGENSRWSTSGLTRPRFRSATSTSR